MKRYRLTPTESTTSIPKFDDILQDRPSGTLPVNVAFSTSPPLEKDGTTVFRDMDGNLLPIKDTNSSSTIFKLSEVAESRVSTHTRTGVAIYQHAGGREVTRKNVDAEVLLNMHFATDANSNIWASCCYEDDDGIYQDGAICYKNARNNFANVDITDFTYDSVLTDGILDQKKVQLLHNSEVGVFMGGTIEDLDEIKGKPVYSVGLEPVNGFYMSQVNEIEKSKEQIAEEKRLVKEEKSITKKTATNHPDIWHQVTNFPKKKGKTKDGIYKYDYTIDTSDLSFSRFYRRENFGVRSVASLARYNQNYYNRFKLAMPDDALSRGFLHVFFTRPDCNILKPDGKTYQARVQADPFFAWQMKTKRGIIDNLYLKNGQDHYWNLLLSNKARGFSLSDEVLKEYEYGKTYQGNSIHLPKTTVESLANGGFEIPFKDSRNLDLLAFHKAWILYINNVVLGKWDPRIKYIQEKTVDFCTAVYVVITAEDFETILYWAKYYGVFPLNVPFSALSWTYGEPLITPDFTISYGYSWREEWNPTNLLELNKVTWRGYIPTGKVTYVPSFNPDVGHAGETWVGPPFVEFFNNPTAITERTSQSHETMKLRFKERSEEIIAR